MVLSMTNALMEEIQIQENYKHQSGFRISRQCKGILPGETWEDEDETNDEDASSDTEYEYYYGEDEEHSWTQRPSTTEDSPDPNQDDSTTHGASSTTNMTTDTDLDT